MLGSLGKGLRINVFLHQGLGFRVWASTRILTRQSSKEEMSAVSTPLMVQSSIEDLEKSIRCLSGVLRFIRVHVAM